MPQKDMAAAELEAARIETREALKCLEQLLLGQLPGEVVDAQQLGVVMRLIAQRANCASCPHLMRLAAAGSLPALG
jgi:hypothetical protein